MLNKDCLRCLRYIDLPPVSTYYALLGATTLIP